MAIKLTAENILKKFDKYIVFQDISFSISTHESLAITGDNGIGKSTLLEIIAGIQKPTSGKMIYESGGKEIDINLIRDSMGFSSPKINPYGELTALENLRFVFSKTENGNKGKYSIEYLKNYLEMFCLFKEMNKQVKYLSSGMKQRLRLLFAIICDPQIIILDEPGSNLDSGGKELIYNYIESVKDRKLIIIATNQNQEARLCDAEICLGRQSFKESAKGLQS